MTEQETFDSTGQPLCRRHLFMILLAVLLAHGVMLTRGLVWDDPIFLDQLHAIGRWHLWTPDPFGFTRPGKIFLYSLYDIIWGSFAPGWQLCGLLLLLGTALLVWLFALEFLPPAGALVAALVYAVHPMHVEGAGWVAASNGLWLTFLALSYYVLILGETRRPRPWVPWIITACFAGALLMKEDAVVLPVVAGLCLWVKGRRPSRPLMIQFGLQIVLALGFVVISRLNSARIGQQLIPSDYPQWVMSLNAPHAILRHVLYFFAPFRWEYYRAPLVEPGEFYPRLALGLVALGALLVWIGRRIGRRWCRPDAMLLGMLIAVVSLIPVSNFIPLGNDLFGVRYLLHPGVGLALLAGAVATRFLAAGARSRLIGAGVLALWLVAAVVVDWPSHRTWSSTERLFTKLCAVNQKGYCYSVLAKIAYEKGDFQRSMTMVTEGMTHDPKREEKSLKIILGMLLTRQGQPDKALAVWKEVEARKGLNADLAINLADYYDTRYQQRKAADDFKSADYYYDQASRTLSQNSMNAWANRGLLWIARDPAKGIAIWEEGLKRFPGSVAMQKNLALARRKQQKV